MKIWQLMTDSLDEQPAEELEEDIVGGDSELEENMVEEEEEIRGV